MTEDLAFSCQYRSPEDEEPADLRLEHGRTIAWHFVFIVHRQVLEMSLQCLRRHPSTRKFTFGNETEAMNPDVVDDCAASMFVSQVTVFSCN